MKSVFSSSSILRAARRLTTNSIAALVLIPVSLSAQWLDFRTPGIPRTKDGKPNLKAPAPKAPDGKPDLSGLWLPARNEYSGNLIQDVQDDAIFRPEAQAVFKKRVADFSISPHSHCLPEGPHQIFGTGGPDHSLYRIMQSPKVVGILFEGGGFRQIFLDGRPLPKDPNPAWNGYSIGHWERDTLVVESNGFTERSWLDEAGHPHSEDLRITERFRRVDFGHIQFQITFDDRKVLVKPLTIALTIDYAADTEMLEYVCNEREGDAVHFVGGKEGVKVSAEILRRYVGTYQSKDGGQVTVRLADGQLYMDAIPLVAQSEDRFESGDSNIEFVSGSDGLVTHLLRIAVEGDDRYDRKP
jgi:hypothetical protein